MYQKKILWLLFHPDRAASRGNNILAAAAEHLPNVTLETHMLCHRSVAHSKNQHIPGTGLCLRSPLQQIGQ